MPGLDAQIGGLLVGHGPEGQDGVAGEIHLHAPSALPAHQPHRLGLEAVEDQGVQVVEPVVLQGQGVGVLQAGQGAVPVHPLPVGHQGLAGLLLSEADLIVGKGLPLVQGAAEAGVGTHAVGQGLLAGVGHGDAGGKAPVGELLAHRQLKVPGVEGQGGLVLLQGQLRPVLPLSGHGKLPPPGKAVALHGHLSALDPDLSVLQSPHDGEQQGIAAGPVGRIAAPDVLPAGLVPVGHQLGPQGGDPGGPPAPLQFQFHNCTPPSFLTCIIAVSRPHCKGGSV